MLHIAFFDRESEIFTDLPKDIGFCCRCLNIETQTACFSDLPSLLNAPVHFQIIFMYLSSKDTSALKLVEDLRRHMPSASLVFLSDSRYFAVDAFRFHASHYLMKPFSQTDLMSALKRCFSEQKVRTKQTIQIKPVKASVPVTLPLSDISFIEIFRKIVILHTEETEFHTYSTLSAISQELDESFFQVHKSFIVNMDKIDFLEATDVILKNGRHIPLSRRNKVALKKQYQNFLFCKAHA